jgi:hypothetical protein
VQIGLLTDSAARKSKKGRSGRRAVDHGDRKWEKQSEFIMTLPRSKVERPKKLRIDAVVEAALGPLPAPRRA